MPPADSKKDFNTETLLNEHGKDISGLSEKLGKCYSEDRYNVFQEHVEKIVLKTISAKDGRKEIKEYATEATKEFLHHDTWRKITFWLPTAVAVLAVLVAYFKQ